MNNRFVLCVCVLLLCSCNKENRWDCFKKTGDIVFEQRELIPFTTLETADNIEFILVQDTVDKITIEAGENLIESISSEVENGVLRVKNNNKCNWSRSYKPKIVAKLHFTQLDSIVHNGYGEIRNENIFVANHINISINNNGDVDLAIDAVFCEIDLHQSGDLILNGTCSTLGIWASGNNWIRCRSLATATTFIETKSTGNAFLNSSHKLTVILNGSGDILYSGSPPIIDTQITGTGIVKPY